MNFTVVGLTVMTAGALVVGTVFFVKLQQDKIADLTASLATSKDTVERQALTIDRLTKQQVIDGATVTQFVTELRALRKTAEAQTQAIAELEKTDPDAKAFLATPLPTGLKRVFGNDQARP